MSLTFAQAKVIVARTIGGANDADQLLVAGDAIKVAVQEWNLRNKWNFLLTDNSLTPIQLTSGISTYALPSTTREPYDARLEVGNKRTLRYIEQRDLDRIIRDQSVMGVPTIYTLFRGSNSFNASGVGVSGQGGTIKLYPTPNYTDAVSAPSLYVKYYRNIQEPAADVDTIDIPDRYIYSLLSMAKYYFLVDKDAESARTQEHRRIADVLYRQAERDDQEYEDDDVGLRSQMDYGQAWGADISNTPMNYWP